MLTSNPSPSIFKAPLTLRVPPFITLLFIVTTPLSVTFIPPSSALAFVSGLAVDFEVASIFIVPVAPFFNEAVPARYIPVAPFVTLIVPWLSINPLYAAIPNDTLLFVALV